MKNKIIIIGKKGFLGSNLNSYLKKRNFILNLDYKTFIKKKLNFINNFNYVINCTSNYEYIANKYLKKNDFDLTIANKIKNINIKMIMLSSRKVYKAGTNLKETSILKPKSNYSKNKLRTEKTLLKILKEKILILRISNVVGLNKRKSNIFNLGSKNGMSVLEIIKKCSSKLKIKADIKYVNKRNGDTKKLICNISKASKYLYWKPKNSKIDRLINDEIWWFNFLKYKKIRRKFIY